MDLEKWDVKRRDYLSLGKGTLKSDKKFLRAELRYLDEMAAKFKHTLSPDEKLTMIFVNGRRKHLAENHLDPLRKIWRYISGWRDSSNMAQRNEHVMNRNISNIRTELKKLKLSAVAKQVEQNIRKGLPAFNTTLSYAVNEEEKVSFKLNFSRSATGDYAFDNYNINLTNESTGKSTSERTVNPIEGQFFSAEQAISLLAGRSVALNHSDQLISHSNPKAYKPDLDMYGSHESVRTVWYKLDMNDNLNPSGQLALKEFHSNYNFDIIARLDELKFRDDSRSIYPEVYSALQKGDRVGVEIPRSVGYETIFIEADPQKRDFKYFDEQQVEISKGRALLGPVQLPNTDEMQSTQNLQRNEVSEELIKKQLLELKFKDADDPTKLNAVMQALYRNERVELDSDNPKSQKGKIYVELNDTRTGLTRFSTARSQENTTQNSEETLAGAKGIRLEKQEAQNDLSKRLITLKKDRNPKYLNGRTKSLKH